MKKINHTKFFAIVGILFLLVVLFFNVNKVGAAAQVVVPPPTFNEGQTGSFLTTFRRDNPTLSGVLETGATVGAWLPNTVWYFATGNSLTNTVANTLAPVPPITSQPIYCFKATGATSGFIPDFSPIGCIAMFSYAILFLTSWVLFVTALAFDWTLQWSLAMRGLIEGFPTIQYAWETLRNLINLFFILILVYISIATILQLENYGYKKLLGKLVIAAFLINFSMFFTKIIIDMSNITALVFYKQIMMDAQKAATTGTAAATYAAGTTGAAGAAGNNILGSSAAAATNQWLSFGIMNSLGLASVWGAAATTSPGLTSTGNTALDPAAAGGVMARAGGAMNNQPLANQNTLNPWTMTLVGLGGSVFILILSFIFFAATALFLVRVIVLILLMITSPAAFAAKILPQTSQWSDKWWSQLSKNALFAPVYMALMFVTLKMVWGAPSKIGGNLMSIFTESSTGGIQAIVFFILICAMLITCLIVASSFSTVGGKTMQKWGKSAGDWGKNYAKRRAFAPVSYIADKASKSKLLSPVTNQWADKLAKMKVGGSSYRSRLDDKISGFKDRGNLAKAANTGKIIRRVGETEGIYNNRKKIAEGEGKKAVEEYFGVDENGKVLKGSLNGAKIMARQDLVEKMMKKKADPSRAQIDRSNKNMNLALEAIPSALDDLEASGHVTSAAVTDIKIMLGKMNKTKIESDELYALVDKFKEPLQDLSAKLNDVEKNIAEHTKTIQGYDGSTNPLAVAGFETATKKLAAANAHQNVLSRKKAELSSIPKELIAELRRRDDVIAQSNLKETVGENKPKAEDKPKS